MEKLVDAQTIKVIVDGLQDEDVETDIHMYEYKGVYFSDANVERQTLESLSEWEARTDDVYVISYPKAGSTWTQEIIYLALNGGDVEKAKETHTLLRVPYMEAKHSLPKMKWLQHPLRCFLVLWCLLKLWFRMFRFNMSQGVFTLAPSPLTVLRMIPSPRYMKTHLPVHLLPPDIFKKKSKIVYVARNPKDLAVSFYYFSRWQPLLPKYETWDEFFDDFMEGKGIFLILRSIMEVDQSIRKKLSYGTEFGENLMKQYAELSAWVAQPPISVAYGKWYDHFLGYWNCRHEENILFLKYEDMKKDEKGAVRQICEFLGYHYSDDVIDRITQHSTFGSMKKNPMTNPDTYNVQRAGIVGDWANHFTEAQNKAFDELYEEKLAGTGLEFDFKSA